MKFQFIISLLFILFCAIVALAQTAPPKSVFQSWNETDLIVPLARVKDEKGKSIDRVTATLTGILRIGRKDLDFVDRRAALTVDFRVSKYASLFTGILYRRDELVKNTERYETRFVTGATVSKTWHRFSLRDRNMFEYRLRSGRNNIDVYRQRFQISHPLIYKEKELFAPFISEEVYYNLSDRLWFQNEFFAGITRKINPRTAIDIAYIRTDSKPVNVNGLSLNLKIRLR